MRIVVGGSEVYGHTGGVPFDPGGRVVLLLHGAGMDHSVWRFQTRALAHGGWSALAVDLPGHGRSAGEPPATIQEAADWTVALLEAVGVERVALVGHSMGALIGLEVAASHPVERLVLLGSSVAMPVHPDLQKAADRGDPLAIELILGWSLGVPGLIGGHPQAGTSLAGMVRRLLSAGRPGVLACGLRACSGYSGEAAVARVGCPTLVVTGELDRMTPARSGAVLAAALTEARFEMVPGAGHLVMLEQPDVVRRLMEGFLPTVVAPEG